MVVSEGAGVTEMASARVAKAAVPLVGRLGLVLVTVGAECFV